ncbi:MAG: BMP family ABC transporter substrate-binding protein, partial [Anaerolineae bacterium]|nr:BMP family ABC transporter substrate-binding protein [Anaerolineae bacterium]
MLRKIGFVVVLALLSAIVPAAGAQGSVESVCLVTDIGRINDGTFNQYAYEGMAQAAGDLALDNKYIETVSETDYEANINTCVEEGFDIIVTVGFLIADATRAAAEANPNVYFIGVDQFVADGPTNYVGIQFREDQAGFLVGAMAALVANEAGADTIAGVYGVEIPPVKKFRNGYEQGARFINPQWEVGVNILGNYEDSFIDPAAGASTARQYIGEGAAVIFGAGGPTGSGAIAEAAKAGVFVIGVDQDEYFTTFDSGATEGAEFLITSALKRVDVGVSNMIQVLAEGNMEAFPGGSIYILDVANGGITF